MGCKSCISCEKTNKTHLLPFAMGITYFIQVLINKYGVKHTNEYHPIFWKFFRFFGESFGFLVYFIKKRKEEPNLMNQKSNEVSPAIEEHECEEETLTMGERIKKNASSWLIAFVATILSLANSSINDFILKSSSSYCSLEFLLNGYQILLTSFICFKFFNFQFQKPQGIGMGIMIISNLAYFIYEFIKTNQFDIYNFGFFLISYTCQSVQFCIEKYLISQKNINIYILLGIEGMFGSILTLIILSVANFIPYNNGSLDNFSQAFKSLGNLVVGFSSLAYIIIYLIGGSLSKLSIESLSPTHMTFGTLIVNNISNELNLTGKTTIKGEQLIIFDVSYITALFGLFIFHDMIILKCCGLDEHISPLIENKGEEESKEIQSEKSSAVSMELLE